MASLRTLWGRNVTQQVRSRIHKAPLWVTLSQSVDRASSAPSQLPTPCWLSLGFLMTGSSRPSIFWSERLGGKPTELGRIPRWFWSQNCAKRPPCLLIQRLEFLVSNSSAETCHSILLQKPYFNRMKSIFYNSQTIPEIYNILCFLLKTG